MLSNGEIKEKFRDKVNKLFEDLSTKPIAMLFERVPSVNILEAHNEQGEVVKVKVDNHLCKEVYKFFYKRHDIQLLLTRDDGKKYELMVGSIIYQFVKHIKPTESMLRDMLTTRTDVKLPTSKEIEEDSDVTESFRMSILKIYGHICQIAPYSTLYADLKQDIINMYRRYFERYARDISSCLCRILGEYFAKVEKDEEIALAAKGYVKIGEVRFGHKTPISNPFKDPIKDALDYFNSPEYKKELEREFREMLDSFSKISSNDMEQILKDASDKTIENHKKEAQKELLNDLIGYLQGKLNKLN